MLQCRSQNQKRGGIVTSAVAVLHRPDEQRIFFLREIELFDNACPVVFYRLLSYEQHFSDGFGGMLLRDQLQYFSFYDDEIADPIIVFLFIQLEQSLELRA